MAYEAPEDVAGLKRCIWELGRGVASEQEGNLLLQIARSVELVDKEIASCLIPVEVTFRSAIAA